MLLLKKLLFFLILVGFCSTSCSSPSPPEWQDADGYRWRELRVPARGDAGFTRVAPSRTGIDFANVLEIERALDNEHLLVGSGVALGDVDGDGITDVYLNRLQGPNRLYRNLGEWQFEDVTEYAGVAANDRYSTGAVLVDIDGDGDLDLLVTSLAGPDAVFRNDGTGRFTEATTDAGLTPGLGSTTMTLADVDADGDLDLYLTAYKVESASDVLRMLERSPSEIVDTQGDSVVVAPEFRDHYRMEERRGLRVAVEQAEPDRLYLNDGTGRFEPVSWTEGAFVDEEGRKLERDVDDFGLSARFYDVDADGDPDLYVCNDFDDPDQLWINQGAGTFRATPGLSLRTSSHASMSVDFADLDRDGRVDFFVSEMLARDPLRKLVQIPFHGPLRKPIGVIDDRPQANRNTLFLNRGDGSFAQIAELAGVDASEWTWGSLFLDVDLDGFEDLLVANGYSRDTMHGDEVDRINTLASRATTRHMKLLYREFKTRNVAFHNQGDLTFREVGEAWGFGTEDDISHGMAAGDLDGDGDQDVVVNRLGAPALVLRNDVVRARVAVRLKGGTLNTRGVGAKVRLIGGAVPVQEREMTAGGLYLSSSDPLLTFAAGESDSLALEIDWPSGARTVIDAVRPDRLFEVWENGPTTAVDEAASGGTSVTAEDEPTPLFVDQSHLLDHTHTETLYEDFLFQPLLPYQPSRLGPGVSWIDIDADGDPDLVIPPGSGGRLGYLRNDRDRFTEVILEDTASQLDRTAAVAVPGANGRRLLLVGQSSYEPLSAEEVLGVPAVLRVEPASSPTAPVPVVDGALTRAGSLALADTDGDGDLDLFVGGRMVPAFYPLPGSSRLFRNEMGDFQLDGQNDLVLKDVGLVSGAVFSDVDSDGDPDLLLALEWGPVRLFVNDTGRFTDATEEWGLDALQGRWNGITTGDLNGDGRLDVVVTGWGRNVRHQPRTGRPLVLYHGDLDRNGSWDLLLAQPDRAGNEPRPVESYERLRAAVPSVRARVPTYEAYSEASLGEVLGAPPEEVARKVARRYDHLLLLNRGDRFEAVPLPIEAQFVPAMGVAVADLDGDGREDVFLSQNFFPTRLDQPRHDSGLGLLLQGDGDGGLEAVSSARSGIRIHGDQRGAALADYDGDGRIDLAVAQNGAATKLYRNAGARPGLRVRLVGPEGNPDGIGAVIRVAYAGRVGPAREVHGGSGYWSQDHPVQVLGLEGEPVEVRVRWPGGSESRAPVPTGVSEVTARWPGR